MGIAVTGLQVMTDESIGHPAVHFLLAFDDLRYNVKLPRSWFC
jgi:hypothetical protein